MKRPPITEVMNPLDDYADYLEKKIKELEGLNKSHIRALKTISFKQVPQAVYNIIYKELNKN
jgi:hypothetical protein